MHLPIRLRLTLVFALTMTLLLVAGGTFLYRRLAAELSQSTDAALRAQAAVVSAGISNGGQNFGDQTGTSVRGVETFAQVVGKSGDVVESSQAIGTRPLIGAAELASLSLPALLERSVPGVAGASRLLVVSAGDASASEYVIVGASLASSQEVLSHFLEVLLIGGPVALVIASASGWVLAGRALRPFERVRREAAAVSVSDLDRRLPVPPSRDELARLVTTLNEMLARLQSSFEHERRFVDVASHELRTPLTNLKAELDLALAKTRTPEALEAALESASVETDRLAALAADLLVYSRLHAGRVPIVRSPVRIDELIASSIEAHARTAHGAGVDLAAKTTPIDVQLDGMRIRQAIDNLIDNAVRHTPIGGTVEVTASEADHALDIIVRDTGPGFDPSVLDTAFEPFVRGDDERASGSGAGLGLAIVRGVVETHGGSVSLRNVVGGGAEVCISLPVETATTPHP